MKDAISETVQRFGLLSPTDCLRCEVCCRFPSPDSPLAPFFSNDEIEAAVAAGAPREAFPPSAFGPGHPVFLEPFEDIARCPCFRPERNDCRIYANRPGDCRLYPFMLMYDAPGKRVLLGLDRYCPTMQEKKSDPRFSECADALAALLDGEMREHVMARRGIVTPWKEHIEPLREMPGLTATLCRSDLGLARLTNPAREILAPYFEADASALAGHTFAAVALWAGIFDLHWTTAADCLLVFASGDGDTFLLLPPVGAGDVAEAARAALGTLRALAPDAPSPRIQDADETMKKKLFSHGWGVRESDVEYVYRRVSMAELPGNRYEKKRQRCNHFERNHAWQWRSFLPEDVPAAIALYREWLANRVAISEDDFYVAQAEASFRTFTRALCCAEELGLAARVLEADGRMAGVTVACPLHDGKSFSVMFEVSDLRTKGAAQFMFRRLCRELDAYEFVNAGGSSGLENLKRVKESYRPDLRLHAYVLCPLKG